MDKVRDAFLRLISVNDKLERMMKACDVLGLNDGKISEIRGDILDVVYYLTGEENPFDDFRDSTTYQIMTDASWTDQSKADMLMSEYRQNNCQGKPVFTDPEKMADMVRKNGGYMTPEGDWK